MSEEIPDLPKSESFWQEHIKRAQVFKGSDLEYCRLSNLNPSTFCGYKRKLGFVKKTKPRKKASPAFRRIEVKSESAVGDISSKNILSRQSPEWAARFLKEFLS